MSWWNPFSTDANNGKSDAELNAERARLDEQRRRRQEERAEAAEEAGDDDEAEAIRSANERWQREHAANLKREREAIDAESPWDAFTDEVGNQWEKRKAESRKAVGWSLKQIYDLLPPWVWALLALGAVAYFWPVIGPIVKRIFGSKKSA